MLLKALSQRSTEANAVKFWDNIREGDLYIGGEWNRAVVNIQQFISRSDSDGEIKNLEEEPLNFHYLFFRFFQRNPSPKKNPKRILLLYWRSRYYDEIIT